MSIQHFLWYTYTDSETSRNPDIDHEVRWCILKLADLLIRPVEESPPSVKIHIPSTPVVEAPPQLPAVKVPAKAPRVVKSGGPPSKSPLISLNAPTKLKLPASPHPDGLPPKVLPTPVAEAPKKAVIFATPEVPIKVSKPKPPRPSKPASKPAQLPKAQSGGMSLNDLKACRSALKKLKANKHAAVFLQPVDPIRDHAPKYSSLLHPFRHFAKIYAVILTSSRTQWISARWVQN